MGGFSKLIFLTCVNQLGPIIQQAHNNQESLVTTPAIETDQWRWKAAVLQDFLNIKDVSSLRLTPYTWLCPTRWNQACFDAVQIVDSVVNFVQVSRAKSHGLKPRYIVQMCNALSQIEGFQIEHIRISFIQPDGDAPIVLKPQTGSFRGKDNTGILIDWKPKLQYSSTEAQNNQDPIWRYYISRTKL